MDLSPRTLVFDAAAARRIALARAIDEVDTQHRLLSAAECNELEAAAAESAGADERRFIDDRASRFIARVEQRQPRIATLAHEEPWLESASWVLPLAAFAAGVILDRIGDPHKLDLLSPPLLAFIAWNLCVYALLVVLPLTSRRDTPRTGWLRRWMGSLPTQGGRWSSLPALVRARFHIEWLRLAGRFESLRLQQVLHTSAAAWAIGVALSIALGGVVREYRVGWESLWLDAEGVHRLLSMLFAPVQLLLPLDGFTIEDIRQLHSGSGVPIGPEQARKWVKLYLALLAIVVVIPRVALALYAWWRKRVVRDRVTVDASQPYFAAVIRRGRIAASLRDSVPVIALALARAAREKEPRGKNQEAAMQVVLLRVDATLAEAMLKLRRMHGSQGVAPPSPGSAPAGETHFLAELLDAPKAGFAGAAAGMAAGALAGAKIDLLTGGLTMGAGAALGALIGGTGAFGAARWFTGAEVRLSDEQLATVAQRVLREYLQLLGIEAGSIALDASDAMWRATRDAATLESAAAQLEAPLAAALRRAALPQ